MQLTVYYSNKQQIEQVLRDLNVTVYEGNGPDIHIVEVPGNYEDLLHAARLLKQEGIENEG